MLAFNKIEEGKVAVEDGGDEDFNDAIFTWTGQVTYVSGSISRFSANIKGARCGAEYQNAVFFKSKFCDGNLLVVSPTGVEIYNGSVTKNDWIEVSSSFFVETFTNGAVGKFQEDYLNGLEYQVTLVCSSPESITPEITQSMGQNFESLPMHNFWGSLSGWFPSKYH